MEEVIGFVIQIPEGEKDQFNEHVLPQLLADLASVLKKSRMGTTFHFIIDRTGSDDIMDDRISSMIPAEINGVLKRNGCDAIYYGIDSSDKHWTTVEPDWFYGSDQQRYEANEIITGECGIIEIATTLEDDRYNDLIYWCKKRKRKLRVVKPGIQKWYLPDNKKDWDKLRGKMGVMNKSLGLVDTAVETASADDEDAFDTGAKGNVQEGSLPYSGELVMEGVSWCTRDEGYRELVVALGAMGHICVELQRIKEGKFALNSEKFLLEQLAHWQNRAGEFNTKYGVQFYTTNTPTETMLNVSLPAKINGCDDKQCETTCAATWITLNMLSYYGSLGAVETQMKG